MKRLILCADDYGQNKAISQAIIDLLSKNRLTAVSCLTTTADWPSHAKWLNSYKKQADIGLHFNLTFEKPYSLPELLVRSCTRTLSRDMVDQSLNAQLNSFIESMGQLPDFIDGHQHIHQFPVIRDVLLDVYEKRGLKCYLRCTYDDRLFQQMTSNDYLKKVIIQFGLARVFKKQLIQKRIPHPSSFSGIYDFKNVHYRDLFRNFLTQIDDMGLIMCHPGLLNPSDEQDEIASARFRELSYFESDEFLEDCKKQNISLMRFSNNRN